MTKSETVFESNFHRWYVAGQGEVEQAAVCGSEQPEPLQTAYERALSWYRLYVGDPGAELPEEAIAWLEKCGKI